MTDNYSADMPEHELTVPVWRDHAARWEVIARATPYIRGHELPMEIVTFDGLTLPYGELGL